MPISQGSDLTEHSNYRRGIILMLCSSFSFAAMNFFVRWSGDLPFYEKLVFRNLIAIIVSLFLVLRSRAPWPRDGKDWGLLLLRSAVGTVGLFANFYTIDRMLLADASMLSKLAPFSAILFASIFLGEKASPRHYLYILGALVGCVFVIKPGFRGAERDMFPYVIAVIGGIASGGAHTCLRALGDRNVNGAQTVLVFSVFSVAIIVPPFLRTAVVPTRSQLMSLIMIGIAAAAGQMFLTYAYKAAPPKEISIYDYAHIIFSSFFGLIVGEMPDIFSLIGYAILFFSGWRMFVYNRRIGA